MIENTFKKYLIRIMGNLWDVQSHEDYHSVGIPDLSYGASGVNGWIELKQVKEWPVLKYTPVRIAKYTPAQVNWLYNRGEKAGYCYVMVKVENEYFIFKHTCARNLRCGIMKSWYYENCLKHWVGSIIPNELLTILTSRA